jgi:hypothetical protein
MKWEKISGRRLGICTAMSLMLSLAPAIPAWAQESDADRVSRALKEIEALKTRLGELERSLTNQSRQVAGPAASTAGATTPAPGSLEESLTKSGFVRWNELSAGKSRFKLYGFLRLDAIYDDSRPSNTQVPAFIRSEDPAAPAAVMSERNTDDFTIHPRLTRFGIDFAGPNVALLGGATTTGKLEIDFYNLPSSESRNAPRMRHAYLKLGWDELSLLAGQTSDVISPLFPIVNPDFVMWGAGNIGDRRPQLRAEFAPQVGKGKFIFQSEAGLTSANDAQDLDPAAAGGFRDGETSGRPTVQARAAFAMPLWTKQNAELGVWGHRAWERTDSAIGLSGRRHFNSEAFGLDLNLPLFTDKIWLKGEIWKGKNLDDVRGGILQGINVTTGDEVRSEGGFIELAARPLKWMSLHVGYATDNPENSDLPTAGPTVGRNLNEIYYAAWRGYFDPIDVGFDYLNWTTEYNGGFDKGQDNRFQAFISYKF